MWTTAALANTGGTDSVGWWIGGVLVLVLFGGMVWRTLRRNRMKK